MSQGQPAEVQAEPETPPVKRGRKVVPPEEYLDRAIRVMVDGGSVWDIQRKLNTTYATALKLQNEIFEKVWNRIQDDYDPKILASLKREKREYLVGELRNCQRAVIQSFKPRKDMDKAGNVVILDPKPNVRPYNTANTAIKLLNAMDGDNAPTQNLNLNIGATLVDPRQQQSLMNDPEYRRLIMAAEERERDILQGPGHVAGTVRGIGQRAEMDLRPALEVAERADDEGGLRGDPSPGDIHAAQARQERVPVEILPGLVSGDLSGPEGDLGEL